MEKKRYWSYVFAGAGLIVLFCVLQNFAAVLGFLKAFFGIFSPIILGFMIAFVLNLPMRGLERIWDKIGAKIAGKKKKKPGVGSKIAAAIKRPFCLLLSILLILLVLSAVLALIAPEISKAVMMIVEETPGYFLKVKNWWISYTEEYPMVSEYIQNMDIDWDETIKNVIGFVGSGTVGVVGSTLMGVINSITGVVNFIIALIFAAYVLFCKETLARQARKILDAFLPERPRKIFLHVVSTAHRIFCAFVTGQCIEAVILGSLCAIGMMIFRFPYAAMVGALVGVTALIPVVGGLIGQGVGAFLILMNNPVQALMFLIFMVCLQQIENNLIYPRVVGSSVGLPGIWVLAAVMVGGGFGGVAGMLFAVPVASVLYTLLREYTGYRLAKKGTVTTKKNPAGTEPEIMVEKKKNKNKSGK